MFKQRMRTSAFQASFRYNSAKIRQSVDRVDIVPSRNTDYVSRQNVKLAAVRMELRRYRKIDEMIAHLKGLMDTAAAGGAQLVAFPELTGMVCLSLLPRFDRLLQDAQALERSDENLREAFYLAVETFAGFVDEMFVGVFSALADNYNLPIAAGSYYTFEEDRIVNRQLLFDERGRLAGVQDKLFVSDIEHRLGVTPGERVEVYGTSAGSVALFTAQDALNYEPFFIARSLGADIAVAGADPFGVALPAMVYRAHENHLAVVSPGVVIGTELLTHSAPAALYAPFGVTKGSDGLVTEGGQVAIGRVDLERISGDFDVYSADDNQSFIRSQCGTPR